jgi:spermidine/putrescine transport system permease protein
MAVIVRTAFTAGDSPTQPIGFSWQWFEAALREVEYRGSLVHSVRLAALTTATALPLGVTTAIGLQRWRSTVADAGLALTFAAVAFPQTVFATAFFLTIVAFTPIHLGTFAQLLGHITLVLPFVVVVVWSGLTSISRDQEETAMDLGATPGSARRRVVVPQLAPAILAAAAIAWVLSFDSIVLSSWLCLLSDCATLPMRIYGRGAPRAHPVLYAYGSIGLAISLTLGALAIPWLLRLSRNRVSRTCSSGYAADR